MNQYRISIQCERMWCFLSKFEGFGFLMRSDGNTGRIQAGSAQEAAFAYHLRAVTPELLWKERTNS